MPAKYLSRTACVVFPLLLAACAAQPQPAPVEKPQRPALTDLSCDELRVVLEVAKEQRRKTSTIAERMRIASRGIAGGSSHRVHGLRADHGPGGYGSIGWLNYDPSATGGSRARMARMNRVPGIQREMAKRC